MHPTWFLCSHINDWTFIQFRICLGAYIDETWNMAIPLHFLRIRALRGCNGYNPYVFHNRGHHVSSVPKNGAAIWWTLFAAVLICSSNRHGTNQERIVLLQPV